MRVLCQNNILYPKRLLRELHVFRALLYKSILLLECVSLFSVEYQTYCMHSKHRNENTILFCLTLSVTAESNSYICFLRTTKLAKYTYSY